MRYLDAKKRLAVMMATAKYLRIKMNENPNIQINNDDVKVALATALQTVPKDYVITVKDIAVVRNGVRSILVKTEDNKVNICDDVTVDVKQYDTIQTDDYIILKEFVELHGLKVSSIEAANLISLIKAVGILNFAIDHSDLIMAENIIKMSDAIQTDIDSSNILTVDSFNTVSEFVTYETKSSRPINIDHVLSFINNVTIELEEIKAAIGTASYITIKADNLLKAVRALHLNIVSSTHDKQDVTISLDAEDSIASEEVIKTAGKLVFDYMVVLSITLAGKTSLKTNFELLNEKSVHVSLEEKIISQFSNALTDKFARYLGVNDELFASGQLALDFEQFIAVDFGIDTFMKVSDIVSIEHAFSLPTEIIAKLCVPNDVKLTLLNGADVIYDYTLTIKDSVTLGRFKYSILQNFDEDYTASLDDLILDDLIYITQ